MERIKLGACEFTFPIWGSLAMEMAHEAGFAGIEITDGGGYLQPHPLNNGYVEYERFGLDLSRQDSFPLNDRFVQEDYLEAAAKYGMEIIGINMYILECQGFIKFANHTAQGAHCLQAIKNTVVAASQMGIPMVTIPVKGLFGLFQHAYALDKLKYAAEVGANYGVKIAVSSDGGIERLTEIVEALDHNTGLAFHTLDPVTSAAGDAAGMIRSLGKERIYQLRVKDMAADDEGFVTREGSRNTLLGDGGGQFAETMEAVRNIGYEGWVLSETAYYSADLNPAGGDYIAMAAKDVETLRSICEERKGGMIHG